jgi:hypothetical protein
VELRGLEPLTPCLQSDVSRRCDRADLASQLSVSSREVPLLTSANGTGTAILEPAGDSPVLPSASGWRLMLASLLVPRLT